MTQEEKELLRKDLCARLPYKPIVHKKWSYINENNILAHNEKDVPLNIGDFYEICNIKPYLRSKSNMTDKEKKELNNVLEFQYYSDDSCMCESTDWLNAHHIDYRGLIEKGLALEAPKDMYKL